MSRNDVRADVGICSWSLRVHEPDLLADTLVNDLGVSTVQLALDPLVVGAHSPDHWFATLRDAGVTVASGMMAPAGEDYSTIERIRRTGGFRADEHWPANLARAERLAAIASDAEIPLVTMHAGSFVDDDGVPLPFMVERISTVARLFTDRGVRVAFETGHEPAQATASLLDSLDSDDVGVNFDPANMLLYASGDPVSALEVLLPRVLQCHVKDAIPSGRSGEWGEEVVVGHGRVEWDEFFALVEGAGRPIGLMVEREAGDRRVADIRSALSFVEAFVTGREA